MIPGAAVIQPLPGIGDMVWHIPHIRALAAHFGEPVTLIAKPRSAADQLFVTEPAVAEVLWLDRNPDRRRGTHDGAIGFARLVAALRRRRFRRVVVLHHSRALAMACMVARIPIRQGYGFGWQRRLLNQAPFLPDSAVDLHPFAQATAWLDEAAIPMAERDPRVAVPPAARAAVRARIGARGFAVLGIGSSEPYKQWGAERFAALAGGLARAGWPRLVLAGGPSERVLADEITARAAALGADATAAIGWRLGEVAALCAEAAFYVGNDTGVMNLAAAVGTTTYALFGAVPPIVHASRIVPILPAGGHAAKADGMARISPDAVLATVMANERSRPYPIGAAFASRNGVPLSASSRSSREGAQRSPYC